MDPPTIIYSLKFLFRFLQPLMILFCLLTDLLFYFTVYSSIESRYFLLPQSCTVYSRLTLYSYPCTAL